MTDVSAMTDSSTLQGSQKILVLILKIHISLAYIGRVFS